MEECDKLAALSTGISALGAAELIKTFLLSGPSHRASMASALRKRARLARVAGGVHLWESGD